MSYSIYYRKTPKASKYALSTVCLDPDAARLQARLTGSSFRWHDWAIVPNETRKTVHKTEIDAAKLPS
jgi:hypothetical protein